MTFFEILFLAHIFGDWLAQTEWQVVNKMSNWRALLTHVIVYHIVVLLVLAARLGFRDVNVYYVTLVLAITHAILDRQWPVEKLARALRLTVNRPLERWLMIVIDQSIHIILIGIAAFYLSKVPV